MKTVNKLEKNFKIVPVLLIGFNRPDFLKRRLDELRAMQVPVLYLSIDGTDGWQRQHTHIDHGNQSDLLHREMANLISKEMANLVAQEISSWPYGMELNVIHHKKNLGLNLHITGAISTVLKHHENIIVIEDDIVLSDKFYEIMTEGLAFQERLGLFGTVGGFSPIKITERLPISNKWRLTKYFAAWGWATNKETWEKFRLHLNDVNLEFELKNSVHWRNLSQNQKDIWFNRFLNIKQVRFNSWDTQVMYMTFVFEMIHLVPLSRIVDNEGFGDLRSTHTIEKKPRWFQSGGFHSSKKFKLKVSRWSFLISKIIDANTIGGDTVFFRQWRQIKTRIIN